MNVSHHVRAYLRVAFNLHHATEPARATRRREQREHYRQARRQEPIEVSYTARREGAPALAWRAMHAAAHDESIRLRMTDGTEHTGTITRVAASDPRPEHRHEALEITMDSGETIHLAEIDLIASTPPKESERVVDLADPRLAANAHKLGRRGHCLTKSRRWSTTFTALRRAREQHVREHLANGAGVPDSQRALAELASEERISRLSSSASAISQPPTPSSQLRQPRERASTGGWRVRSAGGGVNAINENERRRRDERPATDERYLTAREVGVRLGLRPETVLRYFNAGLIPGRRLAGRTRPVRFVWSEVEAAFGGEERAA